MQLLRQPGGDLLPAAAKQDLPGFFPQLIAIHRVVIFFQQRHQPGEVRLGPGGALLLRQRLIEPFSQLSKTLQPQATADGKQTVMEVLAVCLSAFLFAIRGDKVAIHAIEILFAQPFEANVKRIFHHRQRRLRHAEAQALR